MVYKKIKLFFFTNIVNSMNHDAAKHNNLEGIAFPV